MGSNLFGNYHVTPSPTALREAHDLFPRYGDYQEARSHALKLAYWPGTATESGQVVDLNWEEITGMRAPKACELRIDDTIGGFNNLRIIFYVPKPAIVLPGDALPRIWTIGVLQKKTQRFSNYDLATFAARVKLLRLRWYAGH
jgi:hypothetical protein